jgi:hypothetical protein
MFGIFGTPSPVNRFYELFRSCKHANEHFYWDADINKKTGMLKNIFWSHAS